MKVALFIRNGIVGNVVLNKLVQQMLEMGITPVLFNTGEPYYQKSDIPELNEVGFLETGLLRDVVEPFMEVMPPPSNRNVALYTNKQLVKRYGLEYYEVNDVNGFDFAKHIVNDDKIVGGISIRILPIFKQEIINIFEEKGFMWNMHTGLLPRYKGVHIPYRAMVNNESIYGWTLHRTNSGVDTGAILITDYLPLNPKAPVLDTYLGMTDKGADMIVNALASYSEKGTPAGTPQTTESGSYFTYPTREEMKGWNAQGIIFSNDIVDTYVGLYAVPNTLQAQALKNRLEKEIETREDLALKPQDISPTVEYAIKRA